MNKATKLYHLISKLLARLTGTIKRNIVPKRLEFFATNFIYTRTAIVLFSICFVAKT